MPPPPFKWISCVVLLCYVLVAIEGSVVVYKHPWRADLSVGSVADVEGFDRVRTAQFHLCLIYAVELAMALGPCWCAMSPGWTQFDLLIHHAPYVGAVSLCFFGGHAQRWTAPMVMVLLTPSNEGMFIATALGAPDWINKFRRVFGFCGITALWCTESWIMLRNHIVHYQIGRDAMWPTLIDQICWGGIYYHFLLLRMYIRRWKKTRTL